MNILLTGASAGIGKATALELLSRGHRVWGTSRSKRKILEIGGLEPLEMDLEDSTSIASAMKKGLEESGGFDVVINNAGNGVWGSTEGLSIEEERQQFQILVFGPMQIIRAVLPSMRVRGSGQIINITSLAANFVVPFLGTYSAAKAAMGSLSWALQMELQGQPIKIVDLRPGDICSDFHTTMLFSQQALPEYHANADRAFKIYDKNMRTAPKPEMVAKRIASLIDGEPRTFQSIAVGKAFQARIAPFLARFASTSLVRWSTSRYFNLRSRRS